MTKLQGEIPENKCKGQHFYDLLQWSHVVIDQEDSKVAFVICRKCGDLKIRKITDYDTPKTQ